MDQYESSQLKIDYLYSEILLLTERLEEQKKINDEYQKLINGRTDMKMLLSVMQQEQELLKLQIGKLLQERNETVSKCLILEQILHVTQQENKFIFSEAEQRIKNLQEQLKYYEIEISKLQLYEFDPLNEGIVIKYKQVKIEVIKIVNVNEATLKLQQEIENHKSQLTLANLRLSKLQEQRNDLIQLNFTLSNEICKLKLQPGTGVKNIDKYIQQLVEAQRKLIQLDNDDSEKECPSIMEDKICCNKQTIFQDHQMPKLDLKRAQQIQAFTLQQMNLKQQKSIDMTSQEELQKWINEYKHVKNNFEAFKILHEQLKFQFEDLSRKYNETLAINATLIRANQNLEEKWQNINKNYNQYKQFFIQYKDYSDLFNKSLTLKKQQETFSERKDLSDFSLNELKLRNPRDVRRSSVNIVGVTSVDSSANCINYRDKIIQMTKDVFQIFKKKQNENESSDEEIPQVNQMKRELKVVNVPTKQKQNNK